MSDTESQNQEPYLHIMIPKLIWNPDFPQDLLCDCGHPYHRHFDTYDDMEAVGCKYAHYCGCPFWKFPE